MDCSGYNFLCFNCYLFMDVYKCRQLFDKCYNGIIILQGKKEKKLVMFIVLYVIMVYNYMKK